MRISLHTNMKLISALRYNKCRKNSENFIDVTLF